MTSIPEQDMDTIRHTWTYYSTHDHIQPGRDILRPIWTNPDTHGQIEPHTDTFTRRRTHSNTRNYPKMFRDTLQTWKLDTFNHIAYCNIIATLLATFGCKEPYIDTSSSTRAPGHKRPNIMRQFPPPPC